MRSCATEVRWPSSAVVTDVAPYSRVESAGATSAEGHYTELDVSDN